MLSGKPPPVGDDERKAEEGREQAGEKSLRPDIQGGALEMAEGDEPDKHEYPSLRESSDDDDQS
jgi:hypothetical protein